MAASNPSGRRGDAFVFVLTGSSLAPVVQGTLPSLEFSGSLSTRAWGAGDQGGTWLAGALLVRAGQSPLDPSAWVGIRTTSFQLAP